MAARRRLLRPARALALALTLAGCVQNDGTRFNPLDAVRPSWDVDEQREAGMRYDREIQKRVSVIHDPLVAGFLNELGQQIVEKIEPQPFVYRFRVIADPSLNAFALPGGYVYFHSGTLLAVGSIDELAGVMGHEIAHVKARHHLRMAQKAQAPNILAGLIGMGAAVATGEPGALVTAQAVNVAVQLRFGREFETEADQLGSVFLTRAGYDAEGMARFFERILEESERPTQQIPPYLFSHPAVESRIASVREAARGLEPTQREDAAFAELLPTVQARLQRLIDARRTSLPSAAPPPDRSVTEPLLAAAAREAETGRVEAALLTLARAEAAEPLDPRVPYRIGELLSEEGRHASAAAAFERALHLDPSRALVFFKLGEAHKHAGARHRAVYAFEQAMRRAGDGSVLQKRAAWEIDKLTFTIVSEAGFADGEAVGDAHTPDDVARDAFRSGAGRVAWWARLGGRFVPYAGRVSVRWLAPDGSVAQDTDAESLRRPYVASVLELAAPAPGTWTVEAHLEDDVIDRRTVEVLAARGR